jgi:anaerobic magnesium-protoporphyrin IX monomethyl ester cyclase
MVFQETVRPVSDMTNPWVLLIFPKMRERGGHFWSGSGRSLPLGLAFIAAVLEQKGLGVKVLDFQLPGTDPAKLQKLLKASPPCMVGISTSTPCARAAYNLAERIKSTKPSLPIILGGPHPTALGPLVFEDCSAVDGAVLGEGERIVPALVEALLDEAPLNAVPGIVYRTPQGVIENPRPGFITDLDSLPFPARHLFPLKQYVPVAGSYKKLPCVSMITSRGCPHRCVFCNKSIHGNLFRMRSAAKMIEEVETLIADYGAKEIAFFDDSFTENEERILEFCEEVLRTGIEFVWRCSARVDRVDRPLLGAMRRAGCYRIGFGIESGSEKILNNIGKGITLQGAVEAVRSAKREGIETIAYFMLNLPGEEEQTLRETSLFIRRLNPDILLCQLAYPFPGTPLRELVEKHYRILPDKWSDFDGRFSNDVVYLQEGLSAERLERAFQRITRDFYLRPSYLLKSLGRLRDPSQWWPMLKIFLNVLRLRVND